MNAAAQPSGPSTRRRTIGIVAGLVVVVSTLAWFALRPPSSSAPAPAGTTPAPVRGPQADAVARVVQQAMASDHLKAAIVRVTIGGKVVAMQAFGDSMTGVPATTDMHFRNGAVAFEYVSTLLLEYVDEGKVRLDDTVNTWMPDLPEAKTVTLRMLTNQTTGYPDFETDPGWTAAYNADPFHQFTFEERLKDAFNRPLQFAPGTNWSYSHTNFMILGHILSQIGGAPLDRLLQEKVLGPMGLTQTTAYDTATVPEPALHAYSSERRSALGIPPGMSFTEESTYWNPVWGTPIGAAETTTITDMTTTAVAVGTGKLLSSKSFHAMTDSHLIGFGTRMPACGGSCFPQSDAYNYGLGVVLSGSGQLQNPLLSGYSATEAYLPSQKVAVAVATTFLPGAFDVNGDYDNASDRLFREIATALVPDDAPPFGPPRKN
ncbi:serine hydrolase domain-containing protein [Microbacterium capsulatum]|uniref:Serine hydrolase domain-containing protein n=1 Tax=Microbacterium capsulatum TaxID=3041921 RepID=A0ABU0XC81_9MICO|nr:serine hydrolase domain-containing protein [Microbacterium sp. ASV81]MDQ4212708.1 serine hydrolase domain-containing protein [Microbacterium sp. ASV81]